MMEEGRWLMAYSEKHLTPNVGQALSTRAFQASDVRCYLFSYLLFFLYMTRLRLTLDEITAHPRRDYGSLLTRLRLVRDEITARSSAYEPMWIVQR